MKDIELLGYRIETEFKRFLWFFWTLIALIIMTCTNIVLVSILMGWI